MTRKYEALGHIANIGRQTLERRNLQSESLKDFLDSAGKILEKHKVALKVSASAAIIGIGAYAIIRSGHYPRRELRADVKPSPDNPKHLLATVSEVLPDKIIRIWPRVTRASEHNGDDNEGKTPGEISKMGFIRLLMREFLTQDTEPEEKS